MSENQLRQATRQQPENSGPQTLSLSSSAKAVVPAIQRLCSMKRVAEFTPHQAETWMAVLGCYDIKHVNRAVIEFGMSSDPFPDLGKIVERCEKQRKECSQFADGGTVSPPKIVQRVAAALKLDV